MVTEGHEGDETERPLRRHVRWPRPSAMNISENSRDLRHGQPGQTPAPLAVAHRPHVAEIVL